MSKLFVAFIFAALAFNCDYIIEAVESKSNDVISTITHSTTSPTYEPVIMTVEKKHIDKLFDINGSEDDDKPHIRVRILDKDEFVYQPSSAQERIYLCPHETWQEDLHLEPTADSNYTLFEMKFDDKEPPKCSSKPKTLTTYPENYRPKICHPMETTNFILRGIELGIPIITSSTGTKCYREGMKNFMRNLGSSRVQRNVEVKLIEMYQLCYDYNEKRTSWVIREIASSAPLMLDNYTQEQLDLQNETNEPKMILHKLVPSKEDSADIWKDATSPLDNHVPVWVKLKPLIDLIDERLGQYSQRTSRALKIMTKLFYPEGENEIERELYQKIEKPEIFIIQAYDEDEKSVITFVIHNTPENPPEKSTCCEKAVECEFKEWIETSQLFSHYLDDDVTKFAYCCITTKDKFAMLDNIDTEKVIKI